MKGRELTAALRERHRIARDLHDVLAHTHGPVHRGVDGGGARREDRAAGDRAVDAPFTARHSASRVAVGSRSSVSRPGIRGRSGGGPSDRHEAAHSMDRHVNSDFSLIPVQYPVGENAQEEMLPFRRVRLVFRPRQDGVVVQGVELFGELLL